MYAHIVHMDEFQSTRPSRGETWAPASCSPYSDFNPLAPRGARRVQRSDLVLRERISIHSPLAGRDIRGNTPSRQSGISIHSPLAGRDDRGHVTCPSVVLFQSTRPSRGETDDLAGFLATVNISIHSPLAGRDRGSRHHRQCSAFQSTRPSRGETRCRRGNHRTGTISIHSPLAGRDILAIVCSAAAADFNPLAPRGARRASALRVRLVK